MKKEGETPNERIRGEISKLTKNLGEAKSQEERDLISKHISGLKEKLEKRKSAKPKRLPKSNVEEKKLEKSISIDQDVLKRLKKRKTREKKKKVRKPSKYVGFANGLFSEPSRKLIEKGSFKSLERDLVRANLNILPRSYLSIMFLSTIVAFFLGVILFLFFLFFTITPLLPIIVPAGEAITMRFLKVFWLIPVLPILTFLLIYLYPALEKRSVESRINQELPFAAINMASISGSMIDPTKIFSIIISTKEYPYLEKEFTKLLNEINVLGYDMVGALRNRAFNSPSKKLSDLLNGLATTINSGGDLPDFFSKRAESLLFDYRIEREKYTRSAETFMDIYISVVIAAPMILMLLLMMMKISGLGVSLSTNLISILMVIGVTLINIVFLTFLHLKQPSG